MKVTIQAKINLDDIDNQVLLNEALQRLKAIKNGKADYIKKFGHGKTLLNKSYIAYNNFRDEFEKIDNEI